MKLNLKKGSTSNILQIFIADSSSTTGAGLTGLTQASSGLTAYYHRDTDTTATAITLVTMSVGTFTSSGFKEIDATNMPGWYQFCPPNAALATGASNVALHLKGATNMAPLPIEVQLVSYDPYDSTALGLSNLDTTVSSRSTFSGGAVASVTGNVGGNVVGSVASVTAGVTVTTNNDKTGYTVSTVSDKTGYALTTAEHTSIVSDVNSTLDAAGSELSAVPGATGTLRQKINMIFQYLIFKRTTTASTETAYKADSSTTLGTSTVSDDGTTATHGKVS